MRIQIRGANRFVVTDAIKNYIEEKVGSLQRFLPTNQDLEARVYIKIYDVIQKVEVTIPGNQFILRAEEESDNLYAAIDLVVDKLERQIRRHKQKQIRRSVNAKELVIILSIWMIHQKFIINMMRFLIR